LDDEATSLSSIHFGIETAIFETFFFSPLKLNDAGSMLTDTDLLSALKETSKTLDEISTRVNIALWYFYIAAGMFLEVLDALYSMGRRKKIREEWTAIALRVLAGSAVTLIILAHVKLLYSPWVVPIVTLSYFLGTKTFILE
jgi:hypothetical protein